MRLQLEVALVVLDAPAAPTEAKITFLAAREHFPPLPNPVDPTADLNLQLVPCVASCKSVVAIEPCFCLQRKAGGHWQMLAAAVGASSSMAAEGNRELPGGRPLQRQHVLGLGAALLVAQMLPSCTGVTGWLRRLAT